jgi:hypothetical protein
VEEEMKRHLWLTIVLCFALPAHAQTTASGGMNAALDSPGQARISACTLTLTHASNVANTSTNCFGATNIGSILQYNGGSPNFRAVVTAVSGTVVTLSTYYPGATAQGIAFGSGLAANTYNLVGGDICAQINATILNHRGLSIDASGIGGTPKCTISPWTGVDYTPGRPAGRLQLGPVKITTSRQWYIPAQWDLGGFGKAATTTNLNTAIAADAVNYPAQAYPANQVTSNKVVTTLGTNSFQDTSTKLVEGITSTFCIGTTNYGILTLAAPLAGWIEGSQIHVKGVTGSTGWNGVWLLAAVSGLSATVNFPLVCPAVGTLSTATADLVYGDLLQGSTVASNGKLATGSGTFATITSTAGDFTDSDVGSCTVQCTGSGCNGHAGPYDIVAVGGISSKAATLKNGTPIQWSSQPYTKTCWIQSTILDTTYNAGTHVAVLKTNIPMQQSLSGRSVTYSIGGPLVVMTSYLGIAQGQTIEGVNIHDLVVNSAGIPASVALSMNQAQEQGGLIRLGISGWTGYGISCEINCAHHGPWMTTQGAAANTAPPTAAAVMAVEGTSSGPPRLMEAMTWTANRDGSVPYACFELSTPNVTAMNNHCEQYAVNFSIGRYGGTGQPRGVSVMGADPGIALWEGYRIWPSNRANVAIIASSATNGPGKAFLEDDNVSQSCGSGTTFLTDNKSSNPGVALYVLNTSVNPFTRFSSDPEAANCFQGTSTGLQCFASACGGSNSSSPTLTFNMLAGNRVAVNLAASATTVVVNNPVKGQDMDLIVQESGTGGFTFAFPSNFKGFTAINKNANQCNVYHALYDGANWSQVGASNSFAGPCL